MGKLSATLMPANGKAVALINIRWKSRCTWTIRPRLRGWGTKLYEQLFAELSKRHIHVAIGGIALPNPESIALHEKFGMTKVAHFAEVGYKFEKWIDVGYWQKIIEVLRR